MPIPMLALRLATLGEPAATAGLARFVQRVREAERAQQDFQKELKAQAGGSGSGSGGGGKDWSKLEKLARPRIAGDEQRLLGAQEALAEALRGGIESEIADALHEVERLTARVRKQRLYGGSGLTVGAEQRLVEAQKNYAEAFDHGTAAQLEDARAELEKRLADVDKVRGRGLGIRGKYSRLTDARELLRKATEKGTEDEVKDAADELRSAWEAVQRTEQKHQRQPQGFFARLLDLVGQARLTPSGLHMRGVSLNRLAGLGDDTAGPGGGGLSGLLKSGGSGGADPTKAVGALASAAPDPTKALGSLASAAADSGGSLASLGEMFVALDAASGGLLTPFLIIAGLALALVAAFGALVDGTKKFLQETAEAARRMAEVGRAGTISGGSAAEIASLVAKGVSLADIPGASAALGQRISSGGFAISAASKLGLGFTPAGDAFRAGDEAKRLDKALDALGNVVDKNRRRWLARQLGLEQFLPLLDVSPETKAARKRDAGLSSLVNDESSVTRANDFNAAMGRIPALLDVVKNAFFKNALPGITGGLNDLADAIGELGKFVNDHPEVPRFIGNVIGGLIRAGAGLLRFSTGLLRLGEIAAGGLGWVGKLFNFWLDEWKLVGRWVKIVFDAWMDGWRLAYDFAAKMANAFSGATEKAAKLGVFGPAAMASAYAGAFSGVQLPDSKTIMAGIDTSGLSSDFQKLAKALDDNTSATDKSNDLAGDFLTKGGIYGGGSRARGAIPEQFLPSFGASGQRWAAARRGVWGVG